MGLPEGSTNDFERSRLALERNLESLGPELELVGEDGEGDARDDLLDIVVDGRRGLGTGDARAPPTRGAASAHLPIFRHRVNSIHTRSGQLVTRANKAINVSSVG